MAVNVPMIETGIATAGMSVARSEPRKMKITMNTSSTATRSETTTSWIESSMKVEPSYATSSCMPWGSSWRSSGSALRTSCATSTVLAFCCLTMPSPTAGSEL